MVAVEKEFIPDEISAKTLPQIGRKMRRGTTAIAPELPEEVLRMLNQPQVPNTVLEQAIQGDSEAWGQIYETYNGRVLGTCRHRLPVDDVEDVSHTVWEHVFRRIGKFKVTDFPFSAYLAVVTRNAVASYYRKRGNLSYPDEILPEQIRSTDPLDHPEQVVEQNELQNMLDFAIVKLPPSQMRVIQLRFQLGLSIRQTAQSVGKKENNVKQLQHKGVRRLREFVELPK